MTSRAESVTIIIHFTRAYCRATYSNVRGSPDYDAYIHISNWFRNPKATFTSIHRLITVVLKKKNSCATVGARSLIERRHATRARQSPVASVRRSENCHRFPIIRRDRMGDRTRMETMYPVSYRRRIIWSRRGAAPASMRPPPSLATVDELVSRVSVRYA